MNLDELRRRVWEARHAILREGARNLNGYEIVLHPYDLRKVILTSSRGVLFYPGLTSEAKVFGFPIATDDRLNQGEVVVRWQIQI